MNMKIGTYNLEFLFDAGTRLFSGKEYDFPTEFVEKRFAYFAKQFEVLDADILFLQELGDESALIKILEQMEGKYSYFIAKPDEHGVGNAVIFKGGLDYSCESIPTNASLPVFDVDDQDTLGSRIPSRRDYVKLEAEYNDEKLTIVGIHIKSGFLMYESGGDYPKVVSQTDKVDGIIRSEMFRFSQAKKVRQIVDEAFTGDEKAQVIVLGDFNSLQSNKVFEIIRGHIKKDPDALVPILDTLEEDNRYSIIGKHYNGLIDHVLVSKSLEKSVNATQIHNKDLTNHEGNSDYPYIIESDHAPVTFSLI